jgi:hypothetical protein
VNTGVGEGGVKALQSGSSASLVLIAIRTSVGRCLCELGGVKGLGFESQKESQTVVRSIDRCALNPASYPDLITSLDGVILVREKRAFRAI